MSVNNFDYTISIIENNNKIERLNYSSEKRAIKVFELMLGVARYCVDDIHGVLLWQHAKGKTIDNDPHAKMLRYYYK